MLELRSISKSFHDGESELHVLRGVDLSLEAGDSIALTGASGCGKSTLLQIAAGLERADSGSIRILDRCLESLDEPDTALLRRRHLGFVFQQFNLIPGWTCSQTSCFSGGSTACPTMIPGSTN